MPDKNHEFKILFEDMNLSEEASQRIQNKIKSIVLDELGQADLHQNGNAYSMHIPRDWIGFIARQLHGVDANKLQEFKIKDAEVFLVAKKLQKNVK